MKFVAQGGLMFLIGISASAYSQPIPNALVGHSHEQKPGETRWWTMEVEPNRLLFTAMAGEKKGQVVLRVENPNIMEVADGRYLFRWQEENKTTAVHVVDLKNNVEHFSATRPDGTFVILEGTVKVVK